MPPSRAAAITWASRSSEPLLADGEPSEPVPFERIGPGEIDDQIRTALHHAGQRARECRQIPVIGSAVLEPDVEIAPRLEHRVVVLLVDREREDTRIALEDHRGAVAVVDVAVHDRRPADLAVALEAGESPRPRR